LGQPLLESKARQVLRHSSGWRFWIAGSGFVGGLLGAKLAPSWVGSWFALLIVSAFVMTEGVPAIRLLFAAGAALFALFFVQFMK
jgi:hypothetical protein